MPRAHSYRESLPVFRFDVLELRFDYAFDPTIFAMEMLQPAGQCHPWFLSPAVAIYARNLLRQGFLDKLLERVPCRAAVAFALRKSASGISSVVFTNDCSHIYGRRQGQHRQQFSVAFASSCFVPIIRYIWAIRGWQVFCTFRVTSRRILRTTSVNRQK